jgi:hypothetical protein
MPPLVGSLHILEARAGCLRQTPLLAVPARLSSRRIHEAFQAREKSPSGIDLKQLRKAWEDLLSDTTLDNDYLNIVLLDPSSRTLIADLRAAFSIK